MNNLKDINIWESNFGLLPMKLNPLNQADKFLMLNGGQGDFCLKTSAKGDENQGIIYGESWSTNTKNFLFINEDSVEVVNWFEGKTENT